MTSAEVRRVCRALDAGKVGTYQPISDVPAAEVEAAREASRRRRTLALANDWRKRTACENVDGCAGCCMTDLCSETEAEARRLTYKAGAR